MLILTRRIGEKIMINNGQIVIQICKIEEGKVRVAIQAPKDIPVNREEIHNRIMRGEKR